MSDEVSVISAFGRFWEYYFLRYFVGTIVGSVIVRSLPVYCTMYESLQPKGGTMMNLTSSAALGLAYCYIASAPMLTLHVTRAQLFKAAHDSGSGFKAVPGWLFKVLDFCGVLAVVAGIVVWIRAKPSPHSPMAVAGLLLFLLVMSLQIVMLAKARLNKFKVITDFYWKLSLRRANKAPNISEYKESYRHIREHGNACGIVILELALAGVASSVKEPVETVPILVLWLLPAAYCWLFGTVLEERLAE